MTRREAISAVSELLGGVILGADIFLQLGCNTKADKATVLFEKDQLAFLNEIAETILPQTSTPGAKAANVGKFMATMVNDCYLPGDQKVFVHGLSSLDEACKKIYHKGFVECDMTRRKALLIKLDNEAKEYMKSKKETAPNHYFHMVKQLTLLGFFTSEAGASKALRYLAVPGHYDGNYPYKKGDRAWATS